MTKVLRGEVWAVDFEPQTQRQEPTVPPALLKKVEEALRHLTGR